MFAHVDNIGVPQPSQDAQLSVLVAAILEYFFEGPESALLFMFCLGLGDRYEVDFAEGALAD